MPVSFASTATTTTTVPLAWGNWTSSGTTTVYLNQVWTAWNTGNATTPTYAWPPQEAGRAEQREAANRAEQLLAEVVSMDDFRAWKARKFFEVVGSDGHVYRIHRGVNGNVQEYVNGKHVATWCAHPRGVPEADSHVAQVLTLRTDADGFKRVANCHYRAAA